MCLSNECVSLPRPYPNRKRKFPFYFFARIKFSTRTQTQAVRRATTMNCVYIIIFGSFGSLSMAITMNIIIIHSFDSNVVCFLFIFCARTRLCSSARSPCIKFGGIMRMNVCVCFYKIRLSIELMDVMTSNAVMLLYVNIVTHSHSECKRIDKMCDIFEMREAATALIIVVARMKKVVWQQTDLRRDYTHSTTVAMTTGDRIHSPGLSKCY